MAELRLLADTLIARIASYGRCFVAFSGGVDSAVVAQAAQLALGNQATAVTAVSPSLAEGELSQARELTALIGITHREIATQEFANAAYVQNAADRCYHCKTELYEQIVALCRAFPSATIANGTNADDLADYRPGLRAADEHRVRSPLAECSIGKSQVRSLASYFKLPVWDKPAMPCLSSRVAYGEAVTPERLRMIDRAEQFLRGHDLPLVRVRYHRGDVARLEVPLQDLPRLAASPLRGQICEALQAFGFRFVTLDLMGFRSGSLNTLISPEMLSTTKCEPPPNAP